MNGWERIAQQCLIYPETSTAMDVHKLQQSTILDEFFKILLQQSSIMLVDDEQTTNQAKDMKNLDEKVERKLRENFQIWDFGNVLMIFC